MNYRKMSSEELDRKLNKLQNMGLECISGLKFKIVASQQYTYYEGVYGKNLVDFSAIDESKYFEYALQKAFEFGKAVGEESIKDSFRNLLGVKKEEE